MCDNLTCICFVCIQMSTPLRHDNQPCSEGVGLPSEEIPALLRGQRGSSTISWAFRCVGIAISWAFRCVGIATSWAFLRTGIGWACCGHISAFGLRPLPKAVVQGQTVMGDEEQCFLESQLAANTRRSVFCEHIVRAKGRIGDGNSNRILDTSEQG